MAVLADIGIGAFVSIFARRGVGNIDAPTIRVAHIVRARVAIIEACTVVRAVRAGFTGFAEIVRAHRVAANRTAVC